MIGLLLLAIAAWLLFGLGGVVTHIQDKAEARGWGKLRLRSLIVANVGLTLFAAYFFVAAALGGLERHDSLIGALAVIGLIAYVSIMWSVIKTRKELETDRMKKLSVFVGVFTTVLYTVVTWTLVVAFNEGVSGWLS